MLQGILNRLGYIKADSVLADFQPSAPVQKSVDDFTRLIGVPPGGKQPPAEWAIDKHEYVKNLKGASYIAIGAVARRVAMQEVLVDVIRVKKSGVTYEPAPWDHPLRVLFRQVNDIHTQYDLWFYMIAWRLCTGDAYLWKIRNGLNVPAEIWPLASQWVRAIPGRDKFVEEYEVKVLFGGRPEYLPSDEVVHIQEPGINWNGGGTFYGAAPMAAAAVMIDLEVAMLKQLWHRFKNFVPPGLIFEPDEKVYGEGFDMTTMQTIYTWVATQHSMAEHSGKPMVAPPGVKANNVNGYIREMDYGQSLERALEYILAVFGVPKAVVGLSKDFNRANMEASLMAFGSNVINPLLTHTGQHLTQGIAHEFDEKLVIRFPMINLEDRELIRKYLDTGMQHGAVTYNEVREIMTTQGIGNFPPFQLGGNVPWMASSKSPAPFGMDEQEITELQDAKKEAAEAAAKLKAKNAPDLKDGKGKGAKDDGNSDDQEEVEKSFDLISNVRKLLKLRGDSLPSQPALVAEAIGGSSHPNGNGSHRANGHGRVSGS